MEQAVALASLLFWPLFAVVVLGPIQWAVLAWVLMANLDASGGEFAAASSVGLINAVKGTVIPLFLAWRLRKAEGNVLQSWAAKLWIALALYAALAAFWSPFPMAGAKLVGNLVGILLMVIVFERAGRLGLLSTRFLAITIIFSLGLAVVQTYFVQVYGNYAFDDFGRFTSFIAAQQYAALLVAFLAVTLWTGLLKGVHRLRMVLLVFSAILLNGSRTWLIGALIVLSFRWLLSMRKRSILIFSHFLLAIFTLATAIWGDFFYDYISLNLPRLAEFLNAFSDGSGVGSVATYTGRQGIYDAVWQDLSNSSALQIIFGHGTASGGYIFVKDYLNGYLPYSVDPNRIIHDEWLRALYEWGILGFLTFVGVFIVLFVWLTSAYKKSRKEIYIGVLSYLIPLCVALKTENILAGAGNGVTMGFGVLLGTMWHTTDSRLLIFRRK